MNDRSHNDWCLEGHEKSTDDVDNPTTYKSDVLTLCPHLI